MASRTPLVALFGYDSSPFTQKIRMALKLRQIPYTFVLVPSMMPRPILSDGFNLTYRKIPVLAVGKDMYIDTSLILEAVNSHSVYPHSLEHPPVHPDTRRRTLTRLLSSYYTDRPLFRVTTGVIPQAAWESRFGIDRSNLIGHQLDPQKLGEKIPRNIYDLDTHLSIIEPMFAGSNEWFLGTEKPCGADISLYYQLNWGERISRGEGLEDLSAGGAKEGMGDGIKSVFNHQRYPNLMSWFDRMTVFFEGLPNVETRVEQQDKAGVDELMQQLNESTLLKNEGLMETSADNLHVLSEKIGLSIGTQVSIAPDDTGRESPMLGTLMAIGPEETVIEQDIAVGKEPKVQGVRFHFPRVGFVVKPQGLENDKNARRTSSRTAKSKL